MEVIGGNLLGDKWWEVKLKKLRGFRFWKVLQGICNSYFLVCNKYFQNFNGI